MKLTMADVMALRTYVSQKYRADWDNDGWEIHRQGLTHIWIRGFSGSSVVSTFLEKEHLKRIQNALRKVA